MTRRKKEMVETIERVKKKRAGYRNMQSLITPTKSNGTRLEFSWNKKRSSVEIGKEKLIALD